MKEKVEHTVRAHLIDEITKKYPQKVDLTNEEHLQALLMAVGKIIKSGVGISGIESIEKNYLTRDKEDFLFTLLGLKLAKSKLLVNKLNQPLLVSVVFAVYKEHHRIKKNSEHPHGEDFLVKKVEQLRWLFDQKSNIQWELIIVDDGCPEQSGKLAQHIIELNQLQENVRVLYLQDAIDQSLPPAHHLTSTVDSQKGGSIVYGMWDAIRNNPGRNQIIVYTDADLSTHLGQLGLLIDPLLNQDKLVSIGSRREPDSVVIKKGTRNVRGKLFIYLWKRLIPNLGYIIDTQCGFKAFDGSLVPEIIDNLIEQKFAFDLELLLRAELHTGNSIAKIPIAWIDSEEASTTTDLQPYLPMLLASAKMYRKYFESSQTANEFASFIETLDDEQFGTLLDNIPMEITSHDPADFGVFDQITSNHLIEILNEKKL